MAFVSNLIVPVIIGAILLFGLLQNVNVFDVFTKGAKEGLSMSMKILPSLIALMTAVGMFKASGALDILTHLAAPIAEALRIPPQVMPLALLRPISGSGALVIFEDLLKTYGPDSFIGRVASVMQGSTETTFYTIAVYYGAAKITKTRHTVPAALTADMTGFIMSALMVRLLLGS